MPLPAQIQLANTFGNWVDATNDIIVTTGNSSHYILVSQNATPTVSTGNISVNGVMTLATLKANGGIGTDGQFLTSNGSTIHWSTVVDANSSTSGLVNTSVQTFTGNKTFADNVAVTGSITVNALSANGGLGTSGQFLTSNGSTTHWSTLAVVDANSSVGGLVNTAAQTFTGAKTFSSAMVASSTLGVTGAATFSNTLGVTGATTLSNTLAVTGDLTLSKGISANGGFGTAGQFLTSNATYVYWSAGRATETTAQTSNYTLALTDDGLVVLMNVTGSSTLTVPPNSNVAFENGTVITVYNASTSNCVITAGSGVTIRNISNGVVSQYGEISMRKRDTNEWVLVGAVT